MALRELILIEGAFDMKRLKILIFTCIISCCFFISCRATSEEADYSSPPLIADLTNVYVLQDNVFKSNAVSAFCQTSSNGYILAEDNHILILDEEYRILNHYSICHPSIPDGAHEIRGIHEKEGQICVAVFEYESSFSYIASLSQGNGELCYGKLMDLEIRDTASFTSGMLFVGSSDGVSKAGLVSSAGDILWEKQLPCLHQGGTGKSEIWKCCEWNNQFYILLSDGIGYFDEASLITLDQTGYSDTMMNVKFPEQIQRITDLVIDEKNCFIGVIAHRDSELTPMMVMLSFDESVVAPVYINNILGLHDISICNGKYIAIVSRVSEVALSDYLIWIDSKGNVVHDKQLFDNSYNCGINLNIAIMEPEKIVLAGIMYERSTSGLIKSTILIEVD